MTRGRRPEPAALKRAKGNPGRRRIHEPEADTAAAGGSVLSQPPAWLDTRTRVKTAAAKRISALALDIWQRSYPLAEQLRLIKPTDIDAFARWCRYLAEWIEHTCDLDKRGATYETTSPHVWKMLRLNPSAHLRRQTEQALKDLEDRLGFTPAARMRLYQQLAAQQGSLPLDGKPGPADRGRAMPTGEAGASDQAIQSPLGLLNNGARLN